MSVYYAKPVRRPARQTSTASTTKSDVLREYKRDPVGTVSRLWSRTIAACGGSIRKAVAAHPEMHAAYVKTVNIERNKAREAHYQAIERRVATLNRKRKS